jgi:hypothetical protein
VTVHETARRIARACWLEQRCFEVLGGWVASTPEPDVKLAFARQSHHHAWHAEVLARVRPSANGLGTADTDDVPGEGWQAFLDVLASLGTTADRLAGVYGLLVPAKLDAYERWLADTDPVQDAPLRRWLGFVVTDERADLEDGRRLSVAHAVAPSRPALEAARARAGDLLD